MVFLPIDPGEKIPRRPSKLSRAERDTILPFKDEYRLCTSKEQRKAVFRGKIAPAMFEYWRQHDLQPAEGVESTARSKVCLHYQCPVHTPQHVQALAEWLVNNWRPKVTLAHHSEGLKRLSYLDIVFRLHRDLVELAAKEQFSVETIEWSRQPFFGQRLRIVKQVYQNLTEAGKEQVKQELATVRGAGWDEDIQKTYVPCHSLVSAPHSHYQFGSSVRWSENLHIQSGQVP